ncbi:MAG: YbhB/YbcL family Raf kinase inhibitor-like protein, partial [Candidatus Omnitrophica bacterium]|nr:YbhB/YbcL family Raf kinase inhibitor-like protein [Candidatus Omnitrophota bacterium]
AYDIPMTTNSFEAGLPNSETLADGLKQGLTDFHRTGYDGPCPPPGKPHRYYFKLYALDTLLNLPLKQTKTDLLSAMHGHILAEIRLMGKYKRKEDDSAKPRIL